MSTMVRQWLERLASLGSGASDTGMNMIVHLGAGSGDLAEALLATGARRVILVEPQPGLVSGLTGICAKEPRLELRPQAIAATAGSQPMHVLNAAQYSSLRRPTGLSALLPGLREIAQPVVDTIRLETLLDDPALAEGGDNVLLIDTPGEEETLLDQLADLDEGLFRHVLLAGATQALYEDSLPLADLAPRLEQMGYRVVSRDDGDPDFPVLMLERDAQALENRRLSEELEAAGERLSKAAADLTDRDGRIAELEQNLAEMTTAREKAGWKWGDTQKRLEEEQRLTADLEKELAEVTEAREQAAGKSTEAQKQLEEAAVRIAGLEQELAEAGEAREQADADKGEAQKRLQKESARSAELERELAEVTTAREKAGWEWGEAQKRLEVRQRRITELEQELAEAGEAQKQLAEAGEMRKKADADRDEAQKKLTEAQDRIAALEQQKPGQETAAAMPAQTEERVVAAHAEMALAIRMQALRDADLRDLRARYRDLQATKAAQDNLLRQLAERLTAASQYLHQIDQVDATPAPPAQVVGAGQKRTRTTAPRVAKPKTPPVSKPAAKPPAKPKTAKPKTAKSKMAKSKTTKSKPAKPKTKRATAKSVAKPKARAPRRRAKAKLDGK